MCIRDRRGGAGACRKGLSYKLVLPCVRGLYQKAVSKPRGKHLPQPLRNGDDCKVDEEQFTKLYLSNFAAFFDLSQAAIRVFGYFMTCMKPVSYTHLCPAFVDYIKKQFPSLEENISHNLSPMATIAKYMKDADEDLSLIHIFRGAY